MADQGSEGLLSPFLRARRLAAARPYLHGRVLDVGCGVGALAALVGPDAYLGVEVDPDALSLARAAHSRHRFQAELPSAGAGFDTVVCLAVIEHLPDPAAFLGELAARLADPADSCIVLTTPHPAVDRLHDWGAALGLFSKAANEEHQALLDETALRALGAAASLRLARYQRFLLGANQLAVYRRAVP